MRVEEFDDIVHNDVVEFRQKEQAYEKEDGVTDYVVEFKTTPYDILIEKLEGKVSSERTEKYNDGIYIKYKETEEVWDLGYVKFDLNFWKYVEGIFYNYSPRMYKVKGDVLEEITKGDLLIGAKFNRSELDAYIE